MRASADLQIRQQETIVRIANVGSHRRYNPLMDEWVLISPHRTQRPWQGQRETAPVNVRPTYSPNCYLCPNNRRANGERNPDYNDTFVFENDFPALLSNSSKAPLTNEPLFRSKAETGYCTVICFSSRHDLTVSGMSVDEIIKVVQVWRSETERVRELKNIAYTQIFENKGAIMGCSNSHAHCQMWSTSSVPSIVRKDDQNQRDYHIQHGSALLVDYLAREQVLGERIVYKNDSFVVLVPFWAAWPFETMILPRNRHSDITSLSMVEVRGLADAYRMLTRIYDRVFDCEFPYTMGIHQAPFDEHDEDHWQLHLHFYPPLLRSATVKKFMVGYEMLASAQRDVLAEESAHRLREIGQSLTSGSANGKEE